MTPPTATGKNMQSDYIENHIRSQLIVRWLGQQDYTSCWQAMQEFTNQRTSETVDEVWLLEHLPVFTQGQNGKPEHLLNPGDIPVVQTDRGGQITYHGPGQLMVYTLIDLKRKQLNVRELVTQLEQTVIDLLADYHVTAIAKRDAPGVYVAEKKSAPLAYAYAEVVRITALLLMLLWT